MSSQPVFIVGSPRSGTTLLAAMLAAHSKLSCGPETHFFRWLESTDGQRLLDPDNWPVQAVDFVCSISRTTFTDENRRLLIDHYNLHPDQISSFLQKQKPSTAAIVASVTEQYMHQQGKERWAEKTPDHLEHLPDIRSAFPDAQIVRILRDPRDVALSLLKVPWGVSSLLEGLLFWTRQDEISRAFFEKDQNCYTLRFEDLIASPQVELEKLCEFLDIDFEPQMLDTSQTGKNLNSREVAWKRKSSQPIDHTRIQVWRRELATGDNQMAEALIGDRLKAYRYPIEVEFSRLGEIFPALKLVLKYPDLVKKLAGQGTRFWKTETDEIPEVWVYLGDPENDRWLDTSRLDKIRETMALSGKIIQVRAAKNQELYWVPDSNQNSWTGICAYVLKQLLAPHRFAVEI